MAPTIAPIISGARLLLLSVLVLGCGSSSFRWEGKWVGHREIPQQAGINEVARYTLGLVDLDIKGDHTFDLMEGGYPKGGKARFGPDKAFLTVQTVWNRPLDRLGPGAVKMNQEIELTANTDGSITLRDPGGFDARPILLHRRSQPSGEPTRTN